MLPRPDGTLLIAIGDVTGHGPLAALSMAKLRQAIVSASLDEDDSARMLPRAARSFAMLDDAIASVLVAVLDPGSGKVRYASAGHPAPILATAERAVFLPCTPGLLLGVDGDGAFASHELQLGNGDLLVPYTDGLIEAHREVERDEARLLEAAVAAARGTLDAAGIYEQLIGSGAAPDDIALLTLVIAVDGPPRL